MFNLYDNINSATLEFFLKNNFSENEEEGNSIFADRRRGKIIIVSGVYPCAVRI